MIIAVTGGLAAGETSVCEAWKKLGFKTISLSDILRKELRDCQLEVTRPNLTFLGHYLRAKHGKDILAKMAYDVVKDGKDWAIDSILSYEEGVFLKNKGAIILGVTAPLKLRYDRSRDKLKDGITFEEFTKKDEHDRSIGVNRLIEEADFVISNDGTLKDLNEAVKLIFETISSSRAQN